MVRQVKVKPTKVANRLSHQGLITLLLKESLKKRQVDWGFFLLWNEFKTEGPPKEEVKRTTGKRTVTPKSSKRKIRAISPLPQPEGSSSSKKKKEKKKLQFDQAEGNFLNLPYSYSDTNQEELKESSTEQQQTNQEQYQDLPTPTPNKEQEQPELGQSSAERSASKADKINQLLKELYHAKHNEKQVKLKNAQLLD